MSSSPGQLQPNLGCFPRRLDTAVANDSTADALDILLCRVEASFWTRADESMLSSVPAKAALEAVAQQLICELRDESLARLVIDLVEQELTGRAASPSYPLTQAIREQLLPVLAAIVTRHFLAELSA